MDHPCLGHFKDYMKAIDLISQDDSNKIRPKSLIKSYKEWIDFDSYSKKNNYGKSSVDTLLLWDYEIMDIQLIEFKNKPLGNTNPDELIKKFADSLALLSSLPCWDSLHKKYKRIFVYSKSKNQYTGNTRRINVRILKGRIKENEKRQDIVQNELKASKIEYIDDQEFKKHYQKYL